MPSKSRSRKSKSRSRKSKSRSRRKPHSGYLYKGKGKPHKYKKTVCIGKKKSSCKEEGWCQWVKNSGCRKNPHWKRVPTAPAL